MTSKTLIIDDDPVVVYMLKILIQQTELDNNPLTFENGLLAMRYLKEHYNKEELFYIFLDIHMPVMNGWEFLLELSHFADTQNTSVCIVTSSTDQSEEWKATQNPLVAKFLVKPIYKDTLSGFKELTEKK
jgi:CheY-like chemotaxis protein